MSRLVTFCACKADRRERRTVEIDPRAPGSQTCCMGGARHGEMRNLSLRPMVCDYCKRPDRGRNAPVNHYNYPEEVGKRVHGDARAWRLEIMSSLQCRSMKCGNGHVCT